MIGFSYFPKEKPKREPGIIIPALRLAHMWNFSDLRTHLLPLVKSVLGCVDQIVLARELEIKEWLVPAHVELCQRKESLTKEEGTKLGMDSTIMITRQREQFHPSKSAPKAGDYCYGCAGVSFGNYTPTRCGGCGMHLTTAFRYTTGPRASTAPPTDSGTLETQVRKWVEEGCVTD